MGLLVCFGSLSYYKTHVRFSWGHKQMAGHSPSGFFGRQQNSWFHLLQQVFQVLKQQNSPRPSHYCCCVLFLKCGCLDSPQSIFPKVLGIIKMFSGKNETSLNVLFALQWFSSWNSAMPFLPSLFLMVESWTLTLTETSEACSLVGCCQVFCDFLDESSLRSWGRFGWPATPEKLCFNRGMGANTFWHRARFGFFH